MKTNFCKNNIYKMATPIPKSIVLTPAVAEEKLEPVLDPKNARLTIFPIEEKYAKIWSLYKIQEAAFWKAEEVDFSGDASDFETLSKDEQTFIKKILAFFAASDSIVNANLSERFLNEVQIRELLVCYGFQQMMENVHGESYSLMLESNIRDPIEREELFNAIKTVPSIKQIKEWTDTWIRGKQPFRYRLAMQAFLEGVLFSGAFAAIFWLKKYKATGKLFMVGLIKSNELIARDEGLHTWTHILTYLLLVTKLTTEEIHQMFREGVKVTLDFMDDAIPMRLIGINNDSMCQYVKYVTDQLLVNMGYDKMYNVENPFTFMETIGMMVKTNFFEARVTEYQSAQVMGSSKFGRKLVLTDDF